MALEDRCSQAGQPLRHRGVPQIGARDFIAEVQQHFGDPAHADAADAYEMYALNFCEHKVKLPGHGFTRINTDRPEQENEPERKEKELSVRIRVDPWRAFFDS